MTCWKQQPSRWWLNETALVGAGCLCWLLGAAGAAASPLQTMLEDGRGRLEPPATGGELAPGFLSLLPASQVLSSPQCSELSCISPGL